MFPDFLIQIVIVLLIVGLLLWLVRVLGLDPLITRIIQAIVIVCVVIWLLTLLMGHPHPFVVHRL